MSKVNRRNKGLRKSIRALCYQLDQANRGHSDFNYMLTREAVNPLLIEKVDKLNQARNRKPLAFDPFMWIDTWIVPGLKP